MEAPLNIEQVLKTWPSWPSALDRPPQLLGVLLGGRTNVAYRIQVQENGRDFEWVVRLNRQHSGRLGIDRQQEAVILDAVAGAGLIPKPIHIDTELGFLISPLIAGRTWQKSDFQSQKQRIRLRELLDQTHELSVSLPARHYGGYLAHFWQQLLARDAVSSQLKREWQSFQRDLEQFESAGWTPRLTHHDVIPENIVETGNRIFLLDWEYAAMGLSEIDYWAVDPGWIKEPMVCQIIQWINYLWECLVLTEQ